MVLSCYFHALRLGGVLTSPQAAPSGLQMTPPSLPGTENPGKPGSPDFILIWMFPEARRCIESLFIVNKQGELVEYILEPQIKAGIEKGTEDSPIQVTHTSRVQWNLGRSVIAWFIVWLVG